MLEMSAESHVHFRVKCPVIAVRS